MVVSPGIGQHIVPEIHRDADDLQPLAGALLEDLVQQRNLAPAGAAPGGPVIDHQGPARPFLQCALLAVAVCERELRQGFRHPGLLRSFFGSRGRAGFAGRSCRLQVHGCDRR
jgi:hypothetical protein